MEDGGARLEPARIQRRLGGLLAGHDLIGMLEADRRSEPSEEVLTRRAALHVVATARAHGASLLTGDPEILDIETDWDLEDLR